jgi:hypothetical protein
MISCHGSPLLLGVACHARVPAPDDLTQLGNNDVDLCANSICQLIPTYLPTDVTTVRDERDGLRTAAFGAATAPHRAPRAVLRSSFH